MFIARHGGEQKQNKYQANIRKLQGSKTKELLTHAKEDEEKCKQKIIEKFS